MSLSAQRFFIDWSEKRAKLERHPKRDKRRLSAKDQALFSLARVDSDPPPQGLSLDASCDLYRPSNEAS